MKLIIIRGLPGTGKTAVSELLKRNLPNSEIINADDFKLESMQDGKTFENAKKTAYEKSLKNLYEFYSSGKDYVILEELICEKEFLNKLLSFLAQTNSVSYWFRLMRKLRYLLEVESMRKRKIKNSLADFNKLKKDLDSLKIKDEHIIKNDDLNMTVKKILKIIT